MVYIEANKQTESMLLFWEQRNNFFHITFLVERHAATQKLCIVLMQLRSLKRKKKKKRISHSCWVFRTLKNDVHH